MKLQAFAKLFSELIDFRQNRFHPLVWVNGSPKIGEGTRIGFFSEVNAKDSVIEIGRDCDIASFVSINCADSHKRCIGLMKSIQREPIFIGDCVFVGSHCMVKGGAKIGHHSVIASGTIIEPIDIPPYSLVIGETIKEGYYKNKIEGG